jgi:hypothetical protein
MIKSLHQLQAFLFANCVFIFAAFSLQVRQLSSYGCIVCSTPAAQAEAMPG